MVIKIYFGEKPVYVCDEITDALNEVLHHPDAVFIDEISGPAIKSLLHEIVKDEFHAGVLWHSDFEALKKSFFKHFTFIEAAGGLVQNEKKDVLFINRLGKWDLPKGKLEPREDPAACASREITEETGVSNLQLRKKITDTYHTYEAFGKHYLKQTHWFYFTCEGKQTLIPQTEEDITDIKWFKTRDIRVPVANTYEAIKDVLRTFFDTP